MACMTVTLCYSMGLKQARPDALAALCDLRSAARSQPYRLSRGQPVRRDDR